VTARGAPKPRVALVAYEADGAEGVPRIVAEIILGGHREIDFVVISRNLRSDLRPLVRWIRAPAPKRPFRLKLGAFFVTGAVGLMRARADLVHVEAIGPLVPNRVDLVSVQFSREEFYDALGIPEHRSRLRRLSPAAHVALERWCFRRAQLLGAISESGRRSLERRFPGLRIVLTPNGVDVERFRPDAAVRRAERASHGIDENELVALFVGNAWSRKGLDITIEAFARIRDGLDRPPRLWVVGFGDSDRYRALARRHGVADRVTFLGVRNDVERLYQAADLFVLPTLYETFCLVAYEAAATGLPVIATAVSGIDELIGNGEAGIVCERTPESVAVSVTQLADPSLRTRMGNAGRRRARDYSWEQAVRRILDVYDDVLARPGS
jgi:glycosyltransferase involved in cell wall biosynthesis